MEDGIKLALATLTGFALLNSVSEGGSAALSTPMGPLPALGRAEEGQFELLWADEGSGRSVLEGPERTRLVPMTAGEVLAGLSQEWTRYLVDEASSGSGAGTAVLWVRRGAVRKVVPSSTWAYHRGEPRRTSVLVLASGRQIYGVLP